MKKLISFAILFLVTIGTNAQALDNEIKPRFEEKGYNKSELEDDILFLAMMPDIATRNNVTPIVYSTEFKGFFLLCYFPAQAYSIGINHIMRDSTGKDKFSCISQKIINQIAIQKPIKPLEPARSSRQAEQRLKPYER